MAVQPQDTRKEGKKKYLLGKRRDKSITSIFTTRRKRGANFPPGKKRGKEHRKGEGVPCSLKGKKRRRKHPYLGGKEKEREGKKGGVKNKL